MKDVHSYCDNLVAELTVWKAKIYDVVRRIDKLSSGDKGKFSDQVNDLHMFVEELENRMARLRNECPTDWSSDQIEMNNKFDHLKGKLNDIQANFSPGDIGG
jgi:ABC-type phosphate transport system auxiliary subunit